VDPRGAPEPVVSAHHPDQVPDFFRNCRPAASRPGCPAPKRSKSLSMPANSGLGAHNLHRFNYRRVCTIEPYERQGIDPGEPTPSWRLTEQDIQLMPENEDFGVGGVSLHGPRAQSQSRSEAIPDRYPPIPVRVEIFSDTPGKFPDQLRREFAEIGQKSERVSGAGSDKNRPNPRKFPVKRP
jgi:hypothetical protein